MSEAGPRSLWQPPVWLCLLWGFAEATFFFIIPDVLLSWAALSGVRRGSRTLIAIIAGSLLGGLFMFEWAVHAPAASTATVARVPFVRAAMFARVAQDFSAHGAPSMLRGPSSGIPYKVYAVLAPPACNVSEFLLISVPARLERLALSWLAFTAIGWIFRKPLHQHRRILAVLFVAFWGATYAFYWSRI